MQQCGGWNGHPDLRGEPFGRPSEADREDAQRWADHQAELREACAKLRALREAAGLTLEDLAAARVPGRSETEHMTLEDLVEIEAGQQEISMWEFQRGVFVDFSGEWRELIAAATAAQIRRTA